MIIEMECPVCGGIGQVIKDDGSMVLLSCPSCGKDSYVRVHPINLEGPIALDTKVFKACIHVEDSSLVPKLKMKIGFVFKGYNNFRLSKLERQIERGDKFWDLGDYSECEMKELLRRSEKINLKVSFYLI